MALPKKLLSEGEEVVLHLRTHWKALIRPVLIALMTLAAVGLIVRLLPDDDTGRWGTYAVAALAAVVILVLSVWPFLNWLTATYTVTNRRLITRAGVITRTGRDIPLSRINDVAYEHGLIDRILGCGTLVVESAGERGQVVLPDVPHVEQVQLKMNELVFGWQDAARGGGQRSGDEPAEEPVRNRPDDTKPLSTQAGDDH